MKRRSEEAEQKRTRRRRERGELRIGALAKPIVNYAHIYMNERHTIKSYELQLDSENGRRDCIRIYSIDADPEITLLNT